MLIKETLFRWTENDVVDASHRYEREDARTVHFPVTIPRDGEDGRALPRPLRW